MNIISCTCFRIDKKKTLTYAWNARLRAFKRAAPCQRLERAVSIKNLQTQLIYG